MRNIEIFEESKKYMPGGVNSPVRAYKDMGINPPVMKSGKGAIIVDEDNNEYIDFVLAWGPMILGHCNDVVLEKINEVSKSSIAFGAPTNLELEMAKFLCEELDNIDKVRMVNSGTEATMSAIKLARGYTSKNKIVKFAGCYHGHFDGFLVEAGSGVLTEGIAGCLGIPNDSIKNTIIAKYNDIENIKEIFEAFGEDIAGVIIEPVAGNMGVIKAEEDFMNELRNQCDKYNSLLIFDEVMSGFRVGFKGAQELFSVKPDLVTYAKIMGGGLPCGVYGGKAHIMDNLSPLGGVYQAGTMSGNPIVMGAGLATLNILKNNPNIYENIEKLGLKLENGVLEIAKQYNLKISVNRYGGMLTIFFNEKNVRTYEEAKSCDLEMFKKYFLHMNKNGINIPQSQFEAVFLCSEHNESHIDKFLNLFNDFAKNL